MKKILMLVRLVLVLGLVIGCQQPNDSGNGGGETPAPLLTMVLVEGTGSGTFSMGSTAGNSNESPVRDVKVNNFYLGETEITQGQWEAVMGSTWPGASENKIPSTSNGKSAEHPAYYISWYDAIKFCNALSIEEQLEPVYYTGSTYPESPNITKDTNLAVVPNADFAKTGYRLPTEAEWEYAAGGGDSNRTIYAGTSEDGNVEGIDDLGDYAWYSANAGSKTHIVGTAGRTESTPTAKSGNKNALGLYDMSGSVWEWCWDRYGTYDPAVTDNPTGATSGSFRVIRGGCWFNSSSPLRVTNRGYIGTPSDWVSSIGFRVARSY